MTRRSHNIAVIERMVHTNDIRSGAGSWDTNVNCFYDYLDRIAYPSFHLCFTIEGKVPASELYRFIWLKPEDYIIFVYKYVQDNEIYG